MSPTASSGKAIGFSSFPAKRLDLTFTCIAPTARRNSGWSRKLNSQEAKDYQPPS